MDHCEDNYLAKINRRSTPRISRLSDRADAPGRADEPLDGGRCFFGRSFLFQDMSIIPMNGRARARTRVRTYRWHRSGHRGDNAWPAHNYRSPVPLKQAIDGGNFAGGDTSAPAALFARLQSHRTSLRQTQGGAQEGRGTHVSPLAPMGRGDRWRAPHASEADRPRIACDVSLVLDPTVESTVGSRSKVTEITL